MVDNTQDLQSIVSGLTRELQQRDAQLQELQEVIRRLQDREGAAQPPPPPPPPHANPPTTDFPVKEPMVFDGKRSELTDFLTQIRVYFLAQPSKFPSDTARVLATTQFMRGTAYKYVQPLLMQDPLPPEITNFTMFIDKLKEMFGDPNELLTAARNLTSLKQHNSVANYMSDFVRLSSVLDWNEGALTYQFYTGLKDDVKDELAKVERPADLNTLMTLANRIDQRLYERRLERGNRPATTNRPPPRPQNNRPLLPPPPYTGPQPMEIDTTRPAYRNLTPDEFQRRRTLGLCLFCGQPNHIAANCPSRATRKPTVNVTDIINQTHTDQPPLLPAPNQENEPAQ
jgi:hypothetical protein